MQGQAIAIIGGSGLYGLDTQGEHKEHHIDTPYGAPSAPIEEILIDTTRVYFLTRHGKAHAKLPHEINYRANIFALKSLGITHCISINACGSLTEDMKPGDFVLPDSLIDFSSRRSCSFFGNGILAHPSFADPFCQTLKDQVASLLQTLIPDTIHRTANYLCIDGPGFSTRAESDLFRQWGASILGMTLATEAKLAREAEIALMSICIVSDYDCWKRTEASVEAYDALAVLKKGVQTLKEIFPSLLTSLSAALQESNAHKALDKALLTRGDALEKDTTRALLFERFLSAEKN